MIKASESARKIMQHQSHMQLDLARRHGFAWLPLPVLLVAEIVLWFSDIQAPHELLGLLITLNLLLQTLPGLAIAFLFARSFLMTGALGVGLFSCGAVLWGISGLGAPGTAMFRLFAVNTFITIHNLDIWAASLFYLAGAALLQRGRFIVKARAAALLAANVLALAIAGFIALMAIQGWTPAFFVQGQGAAAERQIVLTSAIFTILLTLLLMRRGMSIHSSFASWCALALMLLAIAYLGFMLQTTIGGALSWQAVRPNISAALTCSWPPMPHSGMRKRRLRSRRRRKSRRILMLSRSPSFSSRRSSMWFSSQPSQLTLAS